MGYSKIGDGGNSVGILRSGVLPASFEVVDHQKCAEVFTVAGHHLSRVRLRFLFRSTSEAVEATATLRSGFSGQLIV